MKPIKSKLLLEGKRINVKSSTSIRVLNNIFLKLGCSRKTSKEVSEHLTDSSLCDMESHGIMRVLQYSEQFKSGYMNAKAKPKILVDDKGIKRVSGNGGIGIPVMTIAYNAGVSDAKKYGVSALSIRDVGHTGRHGAFADDAANKGVLTICVGGGNRYTWRQVAPYGGSKAILPTNPWCIGIPGGNLGPVVLDFATSKIAGGWIYAAKSANALLPKDCIIDKNGNPSQNPDDYFNGGAILPSGAQKGYGLALIGELIGEALLGPSTTEANWLLISIDTTRYRNKNNIQNAAEEILDEIRKCPPSKGFKNVEIPGERERQSRNNANGKISIPESTWNQILELSNKLSTIS